MAVEDNQTALDVLTHAINREWIDQPAIARRLQPDPHRSRRLTPNAPGDENEVDERIRHIRRLIEQRRARTREMQRSLGRSL